MSIAKSFIVRAMKPSDRDYLCRTMLYSHFALSSYARQCNRDSFFTGHNKIINALLDYAQVLIVADLEDSDLIYSFIIYEKSLGDFDVIHYAHTRKDFRRLGLLKNLVEVIKGQDCLALSHINEDIRPARLKQFYKKVIVDTYLLHNIGSK